VAAVAPEQPLPPVEDGVGLVTGVVVQLLLAQADRTGWLLQAQTKTPGRDLGTKWVSVAGSDTNNQLTIPIVTTNGSAFFRFSWFGALQARAGGPHILPDALNLNSANGCEQQRREDAKKELGNGKFTEGFGFTCQVKVSDFGEMASIALFSAFASSRLRCSTAASRLKARSGENPARAAKPGKDVQGQQISQIMACLILALVS